MATGVNFTIPWTILLLQKVLDVGNTKMHGFLHSLLFSFFYLRLSIWIFDVWKSRPQTTLMTWVSPMFQPEPFAKLSFVILPSKNWIQCGSDLLYFHLNQIWSAQIIQHHPYFLAAFKTSLKACLYSLFSNSH